MVKYGKRRRTGMINYILCEDDKDFRKGVREQIESFMIRSDMEYEIYEYSNYDKKFEEIVKEDIGFKVYFLDIKTKYGSGIDAARYIREEQEDWISLIVMITAFSEYRYEALGNRLFLLDFINKLDNCKNKINEALEIVMKHYGTKEKSISYEYNYTLHKIEYRNIVSIEKEQESKRSILHTTYGDFKIPMGLNEVMNKLDERFVKIHRSMIANIDKIVEYDIKSNTIHFENGQRTNLIARNKRKELVSRVTSHSKSH